MLAKILKPLADLIMLPIRNALWLALVNFALIGFMIFTAVAFIFKSIAIDLPNFVIFGIRPGDGYQNWSTPNVYIQFLIVSLVLWMINFFFFIFKYSKEMDGAKANEIFKTSLFATFKGIVLLIMFQVLVLFVNIIFTEITNALANGGDNNFGSITDNLIKNMFPDNVRTKIPSIFLNKNKTILDQTWGFRTFIIAFGAGFGEHSKSVLSIGLSLLLVGWLISIPLLLVIFDVVSKVFINFLLFVSFPFLPAFSINDNNKRLQIWKEKYIGNLLSCAVYYIGLLMMGVFVGRTSTFLSNQTAFIGEIGSVVFQLLVIIGTGFSFKKLAEVSTAFIGGSMSNDFTHTAQKGYKAGKEIHKIRNAVKTKGASFAANAVAPK